MNQKELCIKLLDRVPEYKMGYVVAFLQGLTADEETDDTFCEQLYQNYLDDTSPDKSDTITLEELAKQCSVTL